MKKILLSLSAIVLLALPAAKAQIIPNLSFETWSADPVVAGAYDPNTGNGNDGWWDFNVDNFVLLGSSPVTVFKDSVNPAPFNGKYYAGIVSATMTATTFDDLKKYGFGYPKTNGLMFLGNVNALAQSFKAGIPCNNQLKSFSFAYRYKPNGSDSCSCTIALYHWNGTSRTLLAAGYWGTNVAHASWTSQSVQITYFNTSVMPDTAFILFSAATLDSNNNPKAGDTLDIDSGNVVLGINNLTPAENVHVSLYPNPANDEITLAVTSQTEANRVEVYDITGKLTGTYTMYNNLLTINTQQYSTGLYFYKMYDNKGIQLNVGKFSVIK